MELIIIIMVAVVAFSYPITKSFLPKPKNRLTKVQNGTMLVKPPWIPAQSLFRLRYVMMSAVNHTFYGSSNLKNETI